MSKKDMTHLRSGAWCDTVNDPIPEHVKEAAPRKNPLYGGVVIGRTSFPSLAAEAAALAESTEFSVALEGAVELAEAKPKSRKP